MNEPEPKPKRETGASPASAWKSKNYGLGPEPERYSPEWMDWIESRAMVAGLEEAAEDQKKGR
jgi:hypothetical protein